MWCFNDCVLGVKRFADGAALSPNFLKRKQFIWAGTGRRFWTASGWPSYHAAAEECNGLSWLCLISQGQCTVSCQLLNSGLSRRSKSSQRFRKASAALHRFITASPPAGSTGQPGQHRRGICLWTRFCHPAHRQEPQRSSCGSVKTSAAPSHHRDERERRDTGGQKVKRQQHTAGTGAEERARS
ncbi:hypothetical protein MHYP_G00017890 [Metynnis hypsauchen]